MSGSGLLGIVRRRAVRVAPALHGVEQRHEALAIARREGGRDVRLVLRLRLHERVEEGLAGVRDVDTGMALGTGMAPGPFAAADKAGLDVVLAKLEAAAEELGEGFEPPVLLRRLVAQGRTGVAAGQGFYAYA